MKEIFLKLKNKIKTPKKHLGRNLYLSILALIIIGLVTVAILLTISITNTLKSSEKVISLRKEIATETFDINEFNQALKTLDKKISQSEKIDWSKVKNIFLEPGKLQSLPTEISPDESKNIYPR